jgi:hypothetical protein
MDREYIKECKEFKEMQGKYWFPKQGDLCALENGDAYYIGFLVAKHASRDEMGNGWSDNNEYLFMQTFNERKDALVNMVGGKPIPETITKRNTWSNFTFDKHDFIYLPREGDLLKMLGDRFVELNLDYVSKKLTCVIWDNEARRYERFYGKTPELALIRAVKSLKGR